MLGKMKPKTGWIWYADGKHPAAKDFLTIGLREPLLRALVDRSQVESFTRFVPDLENIFIRAVEEDRAHG